MAPGNVRVEPPARPWHALHVEEAVAAAVSDAARGLSPSDVLARRLQFGPNALPSPPGRSQLRVFVAQFQSPLVYLLAGAAVLSLGLGHLGDAAVILGVVVLNAGVGAFQEGRAERSLEALRVHLRQSARVVRGGVEQQVDAGQLVPGDVLLLEAGEAVPADARLLDGAAVQMAEAALTGESLPVDKGTPALAESTPLPERTNMLYAGTHVTGGRARALVVATGPATESGRVALLAEAAEPPKTPLERRIHAFGRAVIWAAGGVFAGVTVLGLWRGMPLGEIALVGVSQVVSMVPEGLPVAVTVALSVGVQRMAARRAVVRRLSAIETLGATNVICTDKTGTLTRNEITSVAVALPDGRTVRVAPPGSAGPAFAVDGTSVEPGEDLALAALAEAVALCSDAVLAEGAARPDGLGDPTELALLHLAARAGVDIPGARAKSPRTAEIPFDASTRRMITRHGDRVLIKGAPETVLGFCDLDEAARASWRARAEGLADEALRTLAVAEWRGAPGGPLEPAALEGRMRMLGLVGQVDPPRPGVKEAVARARAAGIRTVMLTGDHRVTGAAIGRQLGILREGDEVVDGAELEGLVDAALDGRVRCISVFARVHPAQKIRIVSAWQRAGAVVAMTGDGVNDAPALVKADAGVAMGMGGTAAAREASRVVLTDDNFATLVAAVEEGRVVYRNIQKLLLYLLTTSVAEVLVLVAALALGYPPPLAAVQILWINLVTDGLMVVTLVLEPAEGDELERPPLPRDAPLVSRAMLGRMALMVPALVASVLGWYLFRLGTGVPHAQAGTETFTVLALCQWFNALNCRSGHASTVGRSLRQNPWILGGVLVGMALQAAVIWFPPLAGVFHATPFGLSALAGLAAAASGVLWVEELRKWGVRASRRRAALQRGG